MVPAEKSPTSRNGQLLIPPEERFWKRYSPHFELPLASMTSVTLHAMAIGILAIGGIAFLFSGGIEAARPPEMDIRLTPDGLGFGGDQGGAPAGEPGFPGEAGTEFTPGPPDAGLPQAGPDNGASEDLPPVPEPTMNVLPSDSGTERSQNLRDDLKDLKGIIDDANKRAQPDPKAALTAKSGGTKRNASGTGSPKGVGGANGPGGTGKGTRPALGSGGPPGSARKATEAEIKAWRWEFDLKGNPKEHADKLDKAGVIVAVPKGGNIGDRRDTPLMVISDLKRRPVVLQPARPEQFADAVKWYNQQPASIQGLVQELKLPFAPPYIVLLLPKDREARMAAEEKRYADQHGNDLNRVQKTLFDFRLQNGAYEPVVLTQR
jgi:hypothetical protein